MSSETFFYSAVASYMSKDQRKFVVVVFLKNKKIKKAVNTVTNSNVVRNYIFSNKDQVTLILHTVHSVYNSCQLDIQQR